ncbi:NYN domain-containing protein [Victivallis vadensis]|uniref:NYN domain-containing protein n=1 Tax=Victivallis vadensis TaxID=172901 RepID=A0A848B586_9BACT|nr:NYN domain-containing protein [Victivallis vadensis]NMD89357.1 NYN domain-containing protein [Victivallis vadensis]
MNRAIVYVDGFNLYHSLTSPAYKWLDLHKLSASIISSKEALAGVKYFSALCTWDQGKRQRHNNLIRIYRECGVEVILGRFKEVEITCPKRTPMLHCDHRYIRHAEKQTDVNIASQLLRDAYEERVEKAYIISRDSDLIPAIRLLKEMRVRTMVVFPPKTQEVEELKRVCGQHRLLKDKDIENALLPVEYSLKTGEVVSRPDNWS